MLGSPMSFWTTGVSALGSIPTMELVPLVAVPAYFFSFLAWFCVRAWLHGMPRSARFDKIKTSRWLPRFLLEYGYWILHQQVKIFHALRLTANAITILSLLLAALGSWFIAQGRFGLGGWTMFFSFFCDAFDGMVARQTGTASPRGEYFDSFVDRYADFLSSAGFLWYYRDLPVVWLVICASMVGSQAMGYARAKGEAVGIDPNVGWMQRHERAVYLGIGTAMAPIFSAFVEPNAAHPRFYLSLAAIFLVAVLTNASAIWRALYVLERMPAAPKGHAPREQLTVATRPPRIDARGPHAEDHPAHTADAPAPAPAWARS